MRFFSNLNHYFQESSLYQQPEVIAPPPFTGGGIQQPTLHVNVQKKPAFSPFNVALGPQADRLPIIRPATNYHGRDEHEGVSDSLTVTVTKEKDETGTLHDTRTGLKHPDRDSLTLTVNKPQTELPSTSLQQGSGDEITVTVKKPQEELPLIRPATNVPGANRKKQGRIFAESFSKLFTIDDLPVIRPAKNV